MRYKCLALPNDVSDVKLSRLVADPERRLDVTFLDPARLPKKILAHLQTHTVTFEAPQIEKMTSLDAPFAKSVDLGGLRRSHNLKAPEAGFVFIPNLRSAHRLDFRQLTILEAPNLVTGGALNLPNATQVVVPMAEILDGVHAPEANIVYADRLRSAVGGLTLDKWERPSLPQLAVAGPVSLAVAHKVNLPLARELGGLHAPLATDVIAPQLWRLDGNANIPKATAVSMGALIMCGNIDAQSARYLTFNELFECGNLRITKAVLFQALKVALLRNVDAPEVTHFETPKAAVIGDFNANKLKYFDMPCLTHVGKVQIKSALQAVARHLEYVDGMHAPSAYRVDFPNCRTPENIFTAHAGPAPELCTARRPQLAWSRPTP